MPIVRSNVLKILVPQDGNCARQKLSAFEILLRFGTVSSSLRFAQSQYKVLIISGLSEHVKRERTGLRGLAEDVHI
jgi:hypothetical protein